MNKASAQANGALLYMPSCVTARNEIGGRHGTPTSITTSAPNRPERPILAGNFGGASSGARIVIPSGYVGLNQGTVAMWVAPAFAYGSGTSAYLFDTDSTRHAFYHNVNPGTGIEMYNDGRVSDFSSATWTADQPTHLCFVYNKTGNVQQLYINGISQTATATSGTWGSTALGTNAYIGSRFSLVENWQGLIWDVLLYQRPLTANEVMALYAAQSRYSLYDFIVPYANDADAVAGGGVVVPVMRLGLLGAGF